MISISSEALYIGDFSSRVLWILFSSHRYENCIDNLPLEQIVHLDINSTQFSNALLTIQFSEQCDIQEKNTMDALKITIY